MSVAACRRVDAPRAARPDLRRLLPWLACLACALVAPAGHASIALYRCTGSAGEVVYSTVATGYRGCHRVAVVADPAPRRSASRTRSRATLGAERAGLTGVFGSAETSGRRLPVMRPDGWGDGTPAAPPAAAAILALLQVSGTVETSGHALAPRPLPAGWSYRDSSEGAGMVAALAARAGAAAGRVLRGAVYRVVRPDGSVEYTNLPQHGDRTHAVTVLFTYIATCVACNLHSTIDFNTVALHLREYADAIRDASLQFGVNQAFLRAIIHAESAFHPNALSFKGAQGLMQLMPGTAGDMGVADAFDPTQNILGGARYLGLLLKAFNGNEKLAAAAYDAGPGAVQRYHGVPPYAETQVYVQRVGLLRRRYAQELGPALASRVVN